MPHPTKPMVIVILTMLPLWPIMPLKNMASLVYLSSIGMSIMVRERNAFFITEVKCCMFPSIAMNMPNFGPICVRAIGILSGLAMVWVTISIYHSTKLAWAILITLLFSNRYARAFNHSFLLAVFMPCTFHPFR